MTLVLPRTTLQKRSSLLVKIYLSEENLLSSYFVPRAVLEKEFKAVNKTDKGIPPDSHEYCYLDLTRVLVGEVMTKSRQ